MEVKKEYYMAILNTLDTDKRAFLDADIVADRYYLAFDGLPFGGFAVRFDGYLTGLFSKKKGYGIKLFEERLKLSKRYNLNINNRLTLFCTGDKLKELYSEFGFEVYNVIEWNDDYAPKNWDYDSFGRPNLYEMELVYTK